MIKNIFVIGVIAVALLLCNNRVFSQGMKGKFALSISGGLSSPLGDFAREVEEGGGVRANGEGATASYGISGSLEYFVTENYIVGGMFAYRPFGIKTGSAEKELDEWLRTAYEEEGISVSDININGDGSNKISSFVMYLKYKYFESNNILSYLRFGVGMGSCKSFFNMPGNIEFPDAGETNFDWDVDIDTGRKFYLEGGGGCLFKLSDRFAVGGEILYSRLMTENSWVDINIEMEMSGSTQRQKDRADIPYNCGYISAFINFSIFFGGSNSEK